MRAGRFRHKLILQRKVLVQDETTGALTETWSDVANIWGGVEPLSAKEFIAANSVHSKVSARIVIRYRNDIDASMRILFDNKIFNIEGILPDNKSGREYITLPVSEGVNNG